ncbi:hypothetical protein TURU_152085 [Turdus rufiventris]|nr:hypothetical protein TURU_152085 [Turdus rufiventris]
MKLKYLELSYMKAKNRRRQHFYQAGLNHPQNCGIILLITTKAQARLQPMGDLRSEDHVLDDRMALGYSLGSLVNGLPLKLQEEQAASLLVLQHGRRFVRLMLHSLSSEYSPPCAIHRLLAYVHKSVAIKDAQEDR